MFLPVLRRGYTSVGDINYQLCVSRDPNLDLISRVMDFNY